MKINVTVFIYFFNYIFIRLIIKWDLFRRVEIVLGNRRQFERKLWKTEQHARREAGASELRYKLL